MQFVISQHSRQGPRPHNQDRVAYSYSKESLLMVVADGMGGHRHGELAAQLAVQMMTESFQAEATPTIAEPDIFLNEHISHIHEAISNLKIAHALEDSPRTTVVVAILQNDTMYCAHVGDSRAYHYRNGRLLFRTDDHSIVQMLYQKGLILQEDMLTHPERHKIYSCLGGEVIPQISLCKPISLRAGDLILMCTDGLWSAINDQDIAKIFHAGSVSEAVPKLLEIAESLADSKGDNMSAIGLQWGPSQGLRAAISTAHMGLGANTTILNTVLLDDAKASQDDDLSDEDIDRAIAEIQSAINKSKS